MRTTNSRSHAARCGTNTCKLCTCNCTCSAVLRCGNAAAAARHPRLGSRSRRLWGCFECGCRCRILKHTSYHVGRSMPVRWVLPLVEEGLEQKGVPASSAFGGGVRLATCRPRWCPGWVVGVVALWVGAGTWLPWSCGGGVWDYRARFARGSTQRTDMGPGVGGVWFQNLPET